MNMAISVACLVSQHPESPCSVVCVVTGTWHDIVMLTNGHCYVMLWAVIYSIAQSPYMHISWRISSFCTFSVSIQCQPHTFHTCIQSQGYRKNKTQCRSDRTSAATEITKNSKVKHPSFLLRCCSCMSTITTVFSAKTYCVPPLIDHNHKYI